MLAAGLWVACVTAVLAVEARDSAVAHDAEARNAPAVVSAVACWAARHPDHPLAFMSSVGPASPDDSGSACKIAARQLAELALLFFPPLILLVAGSSVGRFARRSEAPSSKY